MKVEEIPAATSKQELILIMSIIFLNFRPLLCGAVIPSWARSNTCLPARAAVILDGSVPIGRDAPQIHRFQIVQLKLPLSRLGAWRSAGAALFSASKAANTL